MAKRSEKKEEAGSDVSSVIRHLPPWLGRDWFLGSILVLAVILAYLPVWRAGFVWDDAGVVVLNPCIVGPLGLKAIWTTSAADICPLTLSTFWVEHALWGLVPLPYHLVNVLVHGACAVVLWRVLRRLQVPGAWLGAALWALHPVAVESVAWITEMKNTESGLFFLLSILFFLKWLKQRDLDEPAEGDWSYALTLLFAVLAMASKSSTVILPVVLFLCAWWMEGRWQWRNVARIAPIFLVSIAASLLSIWTQKLHLAAIAADPQWHRTWPERLAAAGDAVWFYLGKLLWPHPLIAIYPRWEIDAGEWISYLPLLAVASVLLILWLKRASWSRPWFFALAYFLVALFPALGLVDNYVFCYSLVFDHFQYLASMGPLALAGAGIAGLMHALIPERPWLQSTLGAGVLLVLAILSWQRARVFESDETLWTDTLAKNAHCWSACNNLGAILLQKGRTDEAMALFQKALKINPNYDVAHNNLGNTYLGNGQVDKAMTEYQKALEINPNYDLAHKNLGVVLSQKGQLDEAIAEYQRALEINPFYADAYYNLGDALLQKGHLDDAMAQYQKALEINPHHAKAHYSLGNGYLQKGQADEAMAQFQMALEIDPNIPQAHNNLGLVLSQKGQVDEAISQFQKALEIAPSFAEAHTNLGIALAQKGQWDEAIAQFQEALRLTPDDKNAQNNLARALALAKQNQGRK